MQRMAAGSVALVVVALAFVGCGDDDGGEVRNLAETEGTTGKGSGTSTSTSASKAQACTVGGGVSSKGKDLVVSLDEFTIEPAETTVAPGIVSFIAENTGQEPHELAIVKGDDPQALPLAGDGSGAVDDDAIEDDMVGEIEPFAPGQLCRGNFAMPAGNYVLFCNIVEKEDGQTESHFAEGMHTTLHVE